MKCPSCGSAELVYDTRDRPLTYKGQTTIIPAVTGEFCPACGDVVLDHGQGNRVGAVAGAFVRQVNAGEWPPSAEA